MRKITLLILSILLVSCAAECVNVSDGKAYKKHPKWSKNATIYELNTRQFTPEGTLAAATEQLSRLSELGIDIVWVMPIQKIGELNRKGGLGSYYAIQDYCQVNPEFGTEQDFKTFVDKAHSLGMKVILDWVANHTAPDHQWTKIDGWHLRDSVGGLVVRYDWTDIAELNYDNQSMRDEMVKSMTWWIENMNIDGFRCDVAMEVPTEFWDKTQDLLKAKKTDMFMLAEAELPEHSQKAFDAYYGWDMHHILNAIAQQKITTDSLWSYLIKADSLFPQGAIRMNFTSNHDENSWNGTEYERMGDAVQAMAALTFVVPGMPMIYTGQEVGLNKRLRFFDKDTVDFSDAQNHKMTKLYTKLNQLKQNVPAIANQPYGADILPLKNSDCDKVFALKRMSENSQLIAVFNMTPDNIDVTFDDDDVLGEWTNFEDGIKTEVKKPQMSLKPWQYTILYK